MKIIFVAKDGDNKEDGRNSNVAFATITKAYFAAVDGDVIIVGDGVWEFDEDWKIISKRNEKIGDFHKVTIVGSKHSVIWTEELFGFGSGPMRNITMINFTFLRKPNDK